MLDCPEYIVALLFYIEEELDRIMRNIHQEEYDSPFRNSGNVKGFKTDVFEVHAYDWGDEPQPFNFKYGDIEISWYKHLRRGTVCNRQITPKEAVKMFNDCMNSLSDYEDIHDPDPYRTKIRIH